MSPELRRIDDGSAKLPQVEPWTPDGFRACDTGTSASGGEDVLRCPNRAVLEVKYLVLLPEAEVSGSAFCADHQDAGMAALVEMAERGEIHPGLKMRVDLHGFRR